jgi:uncharacterized membrane protein
MMERGFFASLFDLSFDALVTTKLIRFAYIVSIIGIGLAALAFGMAAFGRGFLSGVAGLVILTPLLFLVGVVFARINCELVLVLFRIQAHTAETAERLRAQGSAT